LGYKKGDVKKCESWVPISGKWTGKLKVTTARVLRWDWSQAGELELMKRKKETL